MPTPVRARRALPALLAVLLVIVVAPPAASAQPADPRPPNVVVILLDDLDATTTPYWDALPQTRALLADRGTTFTRSFATDPICCPARATLLTGQYPHNTGVFGNVAPDGGYEAFVANGNEERSLGVLMQGAGYRTGFYGKYLNGYEATPRHVPPGWDEWHAGADNAFYTGYGYRMNENGTLVRYGNDPEDYQTDVLARKAEDFVASSEAQDDQPFLLYVAPTAPHFPIPPAPRHADHPWADDRAPRSPSYNEPDVSDKPTWLQGTPQLTWFLRTLVDVDHRNRMGSLLAVDDLVAGVVAELEANGELDDTVIVFTSDNGYNLGSHRLGYGTKQVPYDVSARVPLVVAGPGIPHRQEHRMVGHPDLVPTALELAGAPVPDHVDGRSLVPLLEGQQGVPWRGDLLIQYRGFGTDTLDEIEQAIAEDRFFTVPSYRAVRTERWLYVEWYEGDRQELELYDVWRDPWQLTNLLATEQGQRRHAWQVALLGERLDELGSCAGASCR